MWLVTCDPNKRKFLKKKYNYIKRIWLLEMHCTQPHATVLWHCFVSFYSNHLCNSTLQFNQRQKEHYLITWTANIWFHMVKLLFFTIITKWHYVNRIDRTEIWIQFKYSNLCTADNNLTVLCCFVLTMVQLLLLLFRQLGESKL